MAKQFVSLATKDMKEGGLIADVDIEVVDSRFIIWDYDPEFQGGGNGPDTTALRWDMKLKDGSIVLAGWSVGGSMIPVDEGDIEGAGLQPAEENAQGGKINKSTNFRLLSDSLEAHGFPVDKLETGRADVFKGLKAHMIRVPAPKRSGLDSADSQGREKTVLVVGEILALPGEKGGAKKRSANKTKASGSSSAASKKSDTAEKTDSEAGAADVDTVASEVLSDMLSDTDSIPLKQMKLGSLTRLRKRGDLDRDTMNAVASVLSSKDWLEDNGATVTDDGNVTLG